MSDYDLNDPEYMRAALRMMVDTMYEPSFVEFMSIPGFIGDSSIGIPEANIIYWDKLSPNGVLALRYLMDEREIYAIPCHPAVYFIDGRWIPPFPIAFLAKCYDEMTWLPLKFRPHNIKKHPTA